MTDVIIRDLEEKDLPAFRSLIVEAFGEGWNFGRFDQSKDSFQALLCVYQSMFLNSSTFGKVAVHDGNVIGAILASAKGEVEKFRHWQKDLAPNTLTLLTLPEAERRDIVEHLASSFGAIGQLLENKLDAYDGSLEFIAVSKPGQGLGIGKALWEEAIAYFKSKHVESIYLIADSACNLGFYDHNGFSIAGKKEVVYHYTTGRKKFDLFVYKYQV